MPRKANDFQLLGDAVAGTGELQKEGWTFGETEMALAVARDHRARVEKLHARDGDPRLDGLNHGIDRTLYAGEIPACGNELFGLPMKAQGRLRSGERRVGKECGSTCRSRWSTAP